MNTALHASLDADTSSSRGWVIVSNDPTPCTPIYIYDRWSMQAFRCAGVVNGLHLAFTKSVKYRAHTLGSSGAETYRMTVAAKTIVTFLLDKSGSMASIRDDTIGAFNTYVDALKAGSSGSIDFTFLQFDSNSVDRIHVAMLISDIPALTRDGYVPGASTPLIDAAMKTINAVEASLSKRDDKPNVVICIQTDGQENASTQFSWADLNAKIKEKTAAGWQFNFMGASIDAYQQAQAMGIHAAQTVSYDSRDKSATQASFQASASATMRYATGQSASTAYLHAEKRASGDAFDPAMNQQAGATHPVGQTHAHPTSMKAVRRAIVDDIAL